MPLKADDTILNGKYRIVRLIAKGGMARVWLAEELTFGGRLVAIKEPRHDLLPDLAHEVRLRYQREVQVCAALDKARAQNIVRAITADPYGDTVLLAMEYMPGGDLATLMKEHPDGLPVEQAVRITLDLLAALEGVHAHEMEIVHRDIKPSNVLFDEQGHAHLADFGLAQLAGMSGRSQLAGGQHPGTPIYMAPEQESSPRTLTPAADLYAVGCLLFEMLTGTRYKRVRPGTAPSALRSEVPQWLDGVVAKALAEDPWERWHDAGEMARPLREGLQREAKARQKAEEREQARPMHRPAWFWPVVSAVGVLLIAIAVGLALLLGGGGDGAETPTPEPTQVAVVEPTASFTPTATHTSPPPTNTPTTTNTPRPTDTVRPTSTFTAGPTRTPRPSSTSTSTPTRMPTNTRPPPPSTASLLDSDGDGTPDDTERVIGTNPEEAEVRVVSPTILWDSLDEPLIATIGEQTLLYPIDLVPTTGGRRHVKARFWIHEADLSDLNIEAGTARIATSNRSIYLTDEPIGYGLCQGGCLLVTCLQAAGFGQPVGIVGGPKRATYGAGDCGNAYRVELWGWVEESHIAPP